MMSQTEVEQARARATEYLQQAGVTLLDEEEHEIAVTDFGLGELPSTGIESVTYVSTELVCAKELILFPRQTCPEHMHPEPGKEETFRCRLGKVYLYVPGKPTPRPAAVPPPGHEHTYTVWHEITLEPGQQYTVPRNTLHWLQAGDQGAVVSEFSSGARDDLDVWTDPAIAPIPVIGD